MAQVDWSETVESIEKHIFRVSTPRGSGSGFLISNGKNSAVCGIATAAHVVDNAHYWEEPIRIEHVSSGNSIVVRQDERAIMLDSSRDTAAIIFLRESMPLPADPLPLAPKDKFLKVGNEIGWLGFPAIPSSNLCFFVGTVSAWIHQQRAYLVDGVSINGVSGGPAFHVPIIENQPVITLIGVVSAYIPNRATGEALPGLSVVQDISQFHELAPTFASIDQAKSAESAQEPPLANPESSAAQNK
jgi:hypothetical protein